MYIYIYIYIYVYVYACIYNHKVMELGRSKIKWCAIYMQISQEMS